jgi:hypothetical protein
VTCPRNRIKAVIDEAKSSGEHQKKPFRKRVRWGTGAGDSSRTGEGAFAAVFSLLIFAVYLLLKE